MPRKAFVRAKDAAVLQNTGKEEHAADVCVCMPVPQFSLFGGVSSGGVASGAAALVAPPAYQKIILLYYQVYCTKYGKRH